MQIILHAVQQLSNGLDQIKQEILVHNKLKDPADRFVEVMKVRLMVWTCGNGF